MDYKNSIKNNVKKEKLIGDVKGTGQDILDFFKNDVSKFIKETVDNVNTVYSSKKEDVIRKSIYTYAINSVESFIVKNNPNAENPVVITKLEIGDTEETLSIAQILSAYGMEVDERYLNTIFDVLKLHLEDESQLDVVVDEDKIVISLKVDEEVETESDGETVVTSDEEVKENDIV